MKNSVIILFLLLPLVASPQVINTIAGDGVSGNTGDGGAATAAHVYIPGGSDFDNKGNYYFATGAGERVRKISPGGIISTVAGTGTAGFSGDGALATNATLNQPVDVGVDTSGNIYIVEASNNCIRKVNALTGMISTIAGTGAAGYNGDGIPATAAMLYNPGGVCVDKSGNIYIADNLNYRVRKINTAGIISTIGGTGVMGYNGDDILATVAQVGEPYGVRVDAIGNLFIADITGRIRKIDASGIIHTIAGTGTPGYSGDGGPASAAKISTEFIGLDKFGNIYTTEGTSNRVRKINSSGYISTFSGNGSPSFSGDNGLASAAALNSAEGIAVDSCGNVYISDSYNYRIRKVTYPHCNYLGIENESLPNTSIAIYPNPANNNLHIDKLQSKSTYRILNIMGATLQQSTLKEGSNNISTRELPTGMYMLMLTDDEGKRTVTKIIKQ